MTEGQDQYKTNDIYLAAYFRIAGCELVNRHQEGRRWYFVFQNPAGSMDELREEYYSGKARVCPKRHSDEIRSMKELCFT